MQDTDPGGTGKHFEQQWRERYSIHRGKIGKITVAVVSAGRMPEMLKCFQAVLKDYKSMNAKIAGGDSAAAINCGDIVIAYSCSDANGKQWAPEDKTNVARELADVLAQFPQGTVSIIGPGKGRNWIRDNLAAEEAFDTVSALYFNQLATCGHPIYDASALYDTMEMNQIKEAIRTKVEYTDPKTGEVSSYKAKTGEKITFDHHFFNSDANYDLSLIHI